MSRTLTFSSEFQISTYNIGGVFKKIVKLLSSYKRWNVKLPYPKMWSTRLHPTTKYCLKEFHIFMSQVACAVWDVHFLRAWCAIFDLSYVAQFDSLVHRWQVELTHLVATCGTCGLLYKFFVMMYFHMYANHQNQLSCWSFEVSPCLQLELW